MVPWLLIKRFSICVDKGADKHVNRYAFTYPFVIKAANSSAAALMQHSLNKGTAHLEVSVYDGRFLLVHVLHGATRLIKDFQHGVT